MAISLECNFPLVIVLGNRISDCPIDDQRNCVASETLQAVFLQIDAMTL